MTSPTSMKKGRTGFDGPSTWSESVNRSVRNIKRREMIPVQLPKPKSSKKYWLLAVGIFAVAIFGFWLVFSVSHNNVTSVKTYPAYTGPAVEYEITGTTSAVSVTLSNPTGGMEQFSVVYLPHTYTYYNFPNNFLYISAQNMGETGSVTVSIYVNGTLYKTSTSKGGFVIATASGEK